MSVGSVVHGWGAHLNAGAAKVWGGIGHGLGWAGKGAASLAGQGAGAFASSWGLFLSKAWAPAMPMLGKAGGWALGMLGKGGLAAGKGFAKGAAGSLQGLATLGAVGLGAVWALGRMSAARRTVTRRVTRIGGMLGVRRGGAVPPAMVMVETGSSETGTSMVAVIALLLVLWYVMSLAFPVAGQTLAGVAPSSYACNVSAPVGGMTGVVSGAGAKLHDLIGKPAPTPAQEAESVHKFALWVGRMWATFQSARDTGQRPEHVIRPLQDPAAFGTCCNTGSSSTTINAGMPTPGDTPAMMAVRAAQAAGFTDIVLADAIAGAESGWNPLATHTNSNGTTDYGMWQINSVHAAVLASGSWQSPADNARMARTVFDGQGWRAWSTFNSGAYRAYLPQAEAAVRAVTGFVGPLPVVPAAAVSPVAAPQTCTPSTFVPTGNTATSPAAETAVRFALAQLGKPYVYGSNGPDSWDCSSLVQAAYAAAGVALPRTTFGQIDAGTVVEPGQERRGDLIFTDPGHVMLALGDGTAVQAPHTGDVVKVSAYARPWQVRRITPTATV